MEMSQDHKDALAQGRKEARAIKAYLKALEGPKSGRPVTRESLEKRINKLNVKIEGSDDPLKSVELLQTRLDIEDTLSKIADHEDFDTLEAGFVVNAKTYSERKGISYTAWREFGVPAATLRNAGVPETRRR
jgi:hypothetical protein